MKNGESLSIRKNKKLGMWKFSQLGKEAYMKKLRKKVNRVENTVEQYAVCYCFVFECLCYCVPSNSWGTIKNGNYGNQYYHVES